MYKIRRTRFFLQNNKVVETHEYLTTSERAQEICQELFVPAELNEDGELQFYSYLGAKRVMFEYEKQLAASPYYLAYNELYRCRYSVSRFGKSRVSSIKKTLTMQV